MASSVEEECSTAPADPETCDLGRFDAFSSLIDGGNTCPLDRIAPTASSSALPAIPSDSPFAQLSSAPTADKAKGASAATSNAPFSFEFSLGKSGAQAAPKYDLAASVIASAVPASDGAAAKKATPNRKAPVTHGKRAGAAGNADGDYWEGEDEWEVDEGADPSGAAAPPKPLSGLNFDASKFDLSGLKAGLPPSKPPPVPAADGAAGRSASTSGVADAGKPTGSKPAPDIS
jgi:hypothetical protein